MIYAILQSIWLLNFTMFGLYFIVFQFYEPCNHSKECDGWRGLVCSPVHERCVCNSTYYHRNRTCLLRNIFLLNLVPKWTNHIYMSVQININYWNSSLLLTFEFFSYTFKSRNCLKRSCCVQPWALTIIKHYIDNVKT